VIVKTATSGCSLPPPDGAIAAEFRTAVAAHAAARSNPHHEIENHRCIA
jgi:hypothetical protein